MAKRELSSTLKNLKDPLRPGVKEAVDICLAAGITVRMVTGDNINTARVIAKECGILTEGRLAIKGPVFRAKSDAEKRELAPRIQENRWLVLQDK
ncbi:unnamed protein product [Lactuca virosa]|uniref:P-type Cu(+) transporter n=1 Tax=Lactuca virosa TaxID=75947 RepID=A0AAU9NEJ9_9ASTR|nr:unnamed protein product [Lactuca virosa]